MTWNTTSPVYSNKNTKKNPNSNARDYCLIDGLGFLSSKHGKRLRWNNSCPSRKTHLGMSPFADRIGVANLCIIFPEIPIWREYIASDINGTGLYVTNGLKLLLEALDGVESFSAFKSYDSRFSLWGVERKL